MINLFAKGYFDDSINYKFLQYGISSGLSVDIFFNDRTSSQLKGTGSMRLIHNKKVADQILQYWSNQLKIQQIHDRFEAVRVEQRKTGYSTFPGWYRLNYKAGHQNDTLIYNIPIITTLDKKMLNEFVNASSTLDNAGLTQYMPALQSQLLLANEIILLIRKEYHLENE